MYNIKIGFWAIIIISLLGCRVDPDKSGDGRIIFKNNSRTVYGSLPAAISTLNPVTHSSVYSEIVYDLTIQPLLNVDLESNELKPVLATSLPEMVLIDEGRYKDGMSLKYTLREEARWDNGTAVTAADVEFSLKAIYTPGVVSPRLPAYFEDIKDVEFDPENPKSFTLLFDKVYFLALEATGSLRIMPEYIYDADKVLRRYTLDELKDEKNAVNLSKDALLLDFAEKFTSPRFTRKTLVGSGPYRYEKWIPKQKFVFVKKENWWGDKFINENYFFEAHPDTIQIRVIPDQTARFVSLKNEDIDVVFGVNSADYIKFKEENKNEQSKFRFYEPDTYNFYFIYLNTRSPILQDVKVRRALAHMIDVDFVISELYDGMASRQNSAVSKMSNVFNPELGFMSYDLEKAKDLLDQSGWLDTDNDGILDKIIDGTKTDFIMRYKASASSDFSTSLASYVSQQLASLGIKVDLEATDFKTVRHRLASREYDLANGALGGSPTLMNMKVLYHTNADTPKGLNRTGFGSEDSDALLDQIDHTLDSEKQKELYVQLQDILFSSQPKIYLFSPKERIIVNKRVKGVTGGFKPFVYLPSFDFEN